MATTAEQQQLSRCQNSRLLQSFRAIGMIVDELPIVWYSMGAESFATASLGKSFVVYKCDKLTPVLVSPQLPKKIVALAVLPKKQLTFTACGRDILVWKRVDHTATLSGHKGTLKQLMVVGNVLFSMDDAHTIRLWDLDTMEQLNEIVFPHHFTPTIMVHPATYLNKILVGSEQGALQLWNIRSMQCIYTFKGWKSSVTALTQSPAVDVVGVGLASGRILMLHLQFDKIVLDFTQEQGRVTALTFRTDSKAPFVASGTPTGDIVVWNLESKRLESIIAAAHDGPISSLVFLQNEPLLLSTGRDNALKMWIFDHLSDGNARLLKSREGHMAPPTRIRYYGNNTLATMADGADGTSCQILSAGQDRAFRVFHTAREQQSTELSQGPMLKKAKKLGVRVDALKLPPITQFAAMETRERDWANVVTCHENEPAAYVWRFEHRAIGQKVLRQYDPSFRVTPGSEEDLRRAKTAATCAAISTCGNYALVGSVGGAVYRYNMQSGDKRGSYPSAATPKPALIKSLVLPGSQLAQDVDNSLVYLHDGPVSGVVVDALNAQVVSAGIDGRLKFWDFRSHAFITEIDVGSAIAQVELHRDANLLAVASDDQVVRVFDVQTRKLVRRFAGHSHRITDLQFARDARWLFTSAADASLRVWDLPTAKCVDWVKFQKPVTGLAVSPTGEFLATTHVGHVGIYLWANRAFFTDVLLDSEPLAPALLDMPVPLNEVENERSDALGYGAEANPVVVVAAAQPASSESDAVKPGGEVTPLDASLITLSTAPRAYWESLFHLELIKKRNKPAAPPKAPEKAPFFLQTSRKDDVQPTFVPLTETKSKPVTETAAAAVDGDAKDGEMEGWGVGSDDEAWGDDDDEDDDAEDVTASGVAEPVAEGSRIMKSVGLITSRCKLATLLAEAVAGEEEDEEEETALAPEDVGVYGNRSRFHAVGSYLQTLSASAVDVELQTLCMGDFDAEGKQLLGLFLRFLEAEMATRRHFQVLQAYLNRFLKLYEQLLVANAELLAQVETLCALQQKQWEHLQQLLHNNLCLVQYFSKIQM